MRLFAAVLISLSLVLGALAGTCAYLPRLSAIDPADELLLAAPAGVDPNNPGSPLLDPGEHPIVLTREVLAKLAEANVQRVRVKSFAFKRWSLGWLFGLSCAGLIVGAVVIRREARRTIPVSIHTDPKDAPEQILGEALAQLQRLRATVTASATLDARREIIDQLDEIFRGKFGPFVESRPALINRLGMAGYAQLMDRFAAAERQLNRAWSAAADQVMDESVDCLADGETRLQEAIHRLAR